MSYQDNVDDPVRHDTRLDEANARRETKRRIQDQVETVIELHEQLVESRERVLLKREKVRTSAKRVQAKRIETGNVEVEFMDGLREFMNRIEQQLPPALSTSYENLLSARNGLSIIEDNYLQAERDLTGTEWTYLDQENDFYQLDVRQLLTAIGECKTTERSIGLQPEPIAALSSPRGMSTPSVPSPPFITITPAPKTQDLQPTQWPPPPPPPPPPAPIFSVESSPANPVDHQRDYEHVITELHTLNREFNALRQEQIQRIDKGQALECEVDDISIVDLGQSEFTTSYFDILLQISMREVEAQQLKGQSIVQRRNSAPEHPLSPSELTFDLISVACTEPTERLFARGPMAKERLCNWLLEYPEASFVERTLRSGLLQDLGVPSPEPDDDMWKELVIQDCRQRNLDRLTDEDELSAVDDDVHPGDDQDEECQSISPLQSAFAEEGTAREESSAQVTDHKGRATSRAVRQDADIDPDLVPLPSSPTSEQSSSPTTALRDSCENVSCEPLSPWSTNDDRQDAAVLRNNSNRRQYLDEHAQFSSPSRIDSGCDLQQLGQIIPCPHIHTTSYPDPECHKQGRALTSPICPLDTVSQAPSTLSHAKWVQKDVLIHDAVAAPSSHNVAGIIGHGKLAYTLKACPSLQLVHIHITPPSPPLSRPASARGRKSHGDRIRCFFARSTHKRSRSTSAALDSCKQSHTTV